MEEQESDSGNFQAFNIGTGVATTVNEMALLLAAGLGKKIQPQVTGQYRVGDIRHCVADITKAKDLLGYSPRVRWEDGIQELIAWVKQQTADDRAQLAASELEQHQLVHSAAIPAA